MTQIKIIRYLIENNSQKFTIREISKNLDIAYKFVYEIIQKLNEENLIIKTKVSASSQIQFNKKLNYKVFQAENKRREDLFKNKNFKIIYNILKEIESPLFIVLLFGSYVKKTNSNNSDIDLCVICNDEKTIKDINSKLKLLPLEIDLNEFSTQEFKSMIKTNEFNVGHEIVKNNIILVGIENYYNLIKNG